jgi:hypothetical protein
MSAVRNIIVVTLAVLVTLASTALIISPVAFAHSAQVAQPHHAAHALLGRSSGAPRRSAVRG